MLAFLDPRSRPPTQHGPTDLNYESWALPRTGPSRKSKCGSGRGTCLAGGADTQAEGCAGTGGCGCESCDGDDLQLEIGGLLPVTASDPPGGDPDDALRLTTPGSFWGVAPDGSWVFWEGRDIGWWDEVDGPWRPDDITIDFPGLPPGGIPDPDPPPCDGSTLGPCSTLHQCDQLLEPPPFSDVCWRTISCFTIEYFDFILENGPDWPPLSAPCPVPCIVERDCGLPTEGEVEAAQSAVTIVPLSDSYLTAISRITPYDGNECNDWVGIEELEQDEQDYVAAALALLLANVDLVTWAACLAVGWSPEDSGSVRVDPATGEGQWVGLQQCLGDFLSGATPWSVFLIGGLWDYEDPDCWGLELTGATGLATRKFPGGVGPNGRPGVVIPIRHEYWRKRIDAFTSAGDTASALCAVLNMAEVILHELVHVCEDDTNSDCDPEAIYPDICCWEEQRMIASMFAWAVTQRYPCLQSEADCHADDPTNFAGSGWVGFQHVWDEGEDAGC